MLRPAARSKPRTRRIGRGGQAAVAYALLAPSLVGALGFLLAPVVIVLVLSLFDWKLLSTPEFIGLANYRKLFTDSGVWHPPLVTLYSVIICVRGTTILSLLLALLVDRKL